MSGVNCIETSPEEHDFFDVQIGKGKISFRSKGNYLLADKSVCWMSDKADGSEWFDLVEGKNREYGFKSCHGKFLSSPLRSGGRVFPNADDMGDNESFCIIPKFSKCFALKSNGGKYLTCEKDGLLTSKRTTVAFLSFADSRDQKSHSDPRARILGHQNSVLCVDETHAFGTEFSEKSVKKGTIFSLHPGKTLGTVALQTCFDKFVSAEDDKFSVGITKVTVGDLESWTVEHI